LVQHLETSEDEEERRYVVAETVLTSEQIEKLALIESRAMLTLVLAILTRFSKDVLMCDRPRNARDSKAQEH
jgi:hypothetical protein